MPFVENLGTGGGSLDAQYGSTAAPNSNAPLLLDPRTSGNFVYMPGSAGNYVGVPHAPELNILGTEGTPFLSLVDGTSSSATTPDQAVMHPTSSLSVRTAITADNVGNVARYYAGQWGPNSWLFAHGGLQALRVYLSTDGVSVAYFDSTATYPYTSGSTFCVRVDWTASPAEVKFYTKPTTPSSAYADCVSNTGWTQLGTTITVGVPSTALFNSTADLSIAGRTTASMPGKYYATVCIVDGSPVSDADFTAQVLGSRGFIESTGKLVSVVGAAAQIVDGTTYGFLPGVAGSYWSTPDVAALDITGDIDIRVRVAMNDWTPALATDLVAKWATSNFSYMFRVRSDGVLSLFLSSDGTTAIQKTSTTATGFTDGSSRWVRMTLDVDNGAGGYDIKFFTAPDSETEPSSWTQLGSTVTTATPIALFSGTAPLTVGALPTPSSDAGRMFRAIIRPNLTSGTKVFDADFTRQLQFAASFTENTGKVVTTNGTARIERERNPELVARVALDAWTGSVQTIIGKDDGSTQRSYRLTVDATGNLVASWAPTGLTANLVTATSTSAVSATAGQTLWLKATVDVVNGNDRTVSFYTAPDSLTEPTVWTLLGTAVSVAGSTSIFPGTSPVGVGAFAAGVTEPIAGKVHRTIIRNGIGGPAVLDLDFSTMVTSGDETAMLTSGPGSPTIPEALQFLPNLGWGGTALNARFGSAVGADTNDPLLLEHDGTNYLYLPGVAGNFASAPDIAAYDIADNLDIRVRVALDDWTPSAQQMLAARYETTSNVAWYFRLNTSGTIELLASDDNTSAGVGGGASTAATGITDGAVKWVRVTFEAGVVKYYLSDDGTTWAQLGNNVTMSNSVTSIAASSARLTVGQLFQGGNNPAAGKFYRAQILSGIGGTTVFDADFTTGITSGGQTTFTESSSNAATVTINRSTSGRKSVAVVRDVLLFGTDDYLQVADNDLLDFAATDSFTVVAVVRQWATTATSYYLAKFANDYIGYELAARAVAQVRGSIYDGVNNPDLFAPLVMGDQSVIASVRDTVADTFTLNVNNVAASIPDTTTLTLANAAPLRIGRDVFALYADMELLGAAIFRRALSASEIALVNTHYQTGPTAASTALLRQAAFWIDTGTRQVAQINRSTAGRKTVACADCVWLLGTDDFFEVPDSPLWDFAPGQDYTLLVLHRGWWAQGTNDTLLATSSSTSASTAGWAMANSTGDPWETSGRHGDGSNGVIAVAPRRNIGALTGTFIVRDCVNDTLTAFTGSGSGTPVTDTTTGVIGNTNVMRLGRLASTGTEYLDAEVAAAVVWRRRLTAAERNAVLAYYGV